MAEQQTYKYWVDYSCSGCSTSMGKILNRALDKGEIDSYVVSLAGKSAEVTATGKSQEAVEAVVSKTSRQWASWSTWAKDNAGEAAELEAKEAADDKKIVGPQEAAEIATEEK